MTGDGKELWRERVSTVMGRDITGNWETASRKEWLVTNGLGGFAAGTVAGANTRRYHGILVATLNPPVERLMVVAKLEVSVMYLGRRYDLSANEFDGGAVEPKGFVHIESFQLEGGIPTWRYAFEAHAPGNDVSLRPNQLFAVSLPYRPLAMDRMKRIVMVCARELLTSYGLRSLGRNHPSYRGRYEGDSQRRDAAYHQGTVWSWLLGPFALAHFHVNGDPPHVARGCVAQAWSVAEILRCWTHLEALRVANLGTV